MTEVKAKGIPQRSEASKIGSQQNCKSPKSNIADFNVEKIKFISHSSVLPTWKNFRDIKVEAINLRKRFIIHSKGILTKIQPIILHPVYNEKNTLRSFNNFLPIEPSSRR